MSAKPQRSLEERVAFAAEDALADHQYVSVIDVLTGIGFLSPAHLDDWRKGRLPYLEQAVQAGPEKVSRAIKMFQDWAQERGLKPGETVYLARTRGPSSELHFSQSGDPAIEKVCRTHYVSPELSEKKAERMREQLAKPAELVVFWTLRDSQCSQCKTELPGGSFLFMEIGRAHV